MSLPGAANVSALNVDQVAEFLLRNQYLLTSLELYQETVERGQESARLKALFTAQKLEEVTAGEDVSAWTSASNFMRPARASAPKGASTPAQTSVDLANRLSLLEYELRQERQTSQELRAELSKILSMKEDALPKAQQTDASVYRKAKPASSIESRILNFIIKKYLVSQGYKLTAISLSSEVCFLTLFLPLISSFPSSSLSFFSILLPLHFFPLIMSR